MTVVGGGAGLRYCQYQGVFAAILAVAQCGPPCPISAWHRPAPSGPLGPHLDGVEGRPLRPYIGRHGGSVRPSAEMVGTMAAPDRHGQMQLRDKPDLERQVGQKGLN